VFSNCCRLDGACGAGETGEVREAGEVGSDAAGTVMVVLVAGFSSS
jgi:hypothetical protein